jgi:hypothetical protein
MHDTRTTPNSDRPSASRAQRRDAALVARYIQELSDRHTGNGSHGPVVLVREPGGEGAHRGGGA